MQEDNIQQTFARRNPTVFVGAVKQQLDLPSLAAYMGSILNGDRVMKGNISRLLAENVSEYYIALTVEHQSQECNLVPGTIKENFIKFKSLMKESMDECIHVLHVISFWSYITL